MVDSNSSDEDNIFEEVDLGPKHYSPWSLRPPSCPIKLRPSNVYATEGSRVAFEAYFEVPDFTRTCVVWHIGRAAYYKTSHDAAVFFENGFSVIVIQSLALIHTGLVQCHLHWIDGERSQLLQVLCSLCCITGTNNVINSVRRIMQPNKGEVKKIPTKNATTTMIEDSRTKNAVGRALNKCRRFFRGISPSPKMLDQNTEHVIHIAFVWFPDGYAYQCITLNKTKKTKMVKLAICTLKRKPYLVMEWNASSTPSLYVVLQEAKHDLFYHKAVTYNNYVAIEAPDYYDLVLYRIMRARKIEERPTVDKVKDMASGRESPQPGASDYFKR